MSPSYQGESPFLPSVLQQILRHPILLGGLFSTLLFVAVVQVSVNEREHDFSVAAEGAGVDFREHLTEGDVVIDSVANFFNAFRYVTEEEFSLFLKSQFKTHIDIKAVNFLANSEVDSRYAEVASVRPLLLRISAEPGEYALHSLYRIAHTADDFVELASDDGGMSHTAEAISEAITQGGIAMGGVVQLKDGSIAFNQYQAIYAAAANGGEKQLLGVIAVLFRPAELLAHIADDYRVNSELRIGEQTSGSYTCCSEKSGVLLPSFARDEIFEFGGTRFHLVFTKGLEWEDVHLKAAVLAFVVGALLTLMMHRLRMANAARTQLLIERNRVIKRQVDEQTRAVRQANAELVQVKAAVDEHAIVSIADITGKITYINDKFCEISGYSREELLGHNHRIVKSDRQSPEFYAAMWGTISRGEVWHGVVCNRTKGGDEYWVNSTIVPFIDDKGLPYQYVSIRTDITPIINAEAALLRSEQEVSSILDTVPALIWYKDRDSRILRANSAAAALVDSTPEAMAGRSDSDFFPADIVARHREDDLKVLQSGEPLLSLQETLHKEDDVHHYRVDRVPYRDENGGIVGLIVMAHDVTAQEKAEQALMVNEERLRRSQGFANIGTWDWNIQSGDLFWSERIAPLFGYNVGDLETTYENFLNAVHPDDRQMVTAAVAACVEAGADYNIEHRVVWPDGQVRWLSEKGDVVRDEAGNPLHMLGVVSDIHDRKMAEAALQESEAILSENEEKFRSLYEMSPVGIALNEMDGSFVEANQSFLEIIGYTEEECRGLTYWELTPEEYAHQEAQQLDSLNAIGHYGPYEKEYRHKDGHRVAVLLHGTVVHDREGRQRIWSIVQDITARKRFEETLDRFKTTLDLTKDCVFMFEPGSLKFFYVNQGAMEQVGYSENELMNMTPVDIKPGFDERGFRDLINPLVAAGEGSVTLETIHRHKAGYDIPVEIAMQYIAPAGEPPRFVSIVRNITERKIMQEKLVEAKEMAELANKAKSAFLSSMSHELRTPLNAILGFTQLIEGDENLSDAQHESLRDISNAGSHLLELINDVLDLAKIEAGKMELAMGAVAVSDVIDVGKNLIAPMADKRGVALTFSPSCLGACSISADFTRTKQVLLNLLSNAVKYNCDGGSVVVDCQAREDGFVRISVSDTGSGISETRQKGLFEAFNRLDAEGGGIEGTGIGLVITRQLVELMGGRIGVDSVVGEGSTFWFELPRSESGERRDAGVSQSQPASPLFGAGLSVLYIEDNPVNLKLVSKLIEKRTRINLLSAEEPVRGIELAVAQRPDLILLDINLPGMSGYEVLHHLREVEATRHIPVVALSANAMESDLKRGEEAGFDGYLTKPINVKEFLSVLKQLLN